MPRLTDKSAIRAILHRDPGWSVYALGDLAPPMFPKTQWFSSGPSPGPGADLTLVLHDFGTSILFAVGTASIREALEHATRPVHLQVQADAFEEIARYATVEHRQQMWRMVWNGPVAGGTDLSAEAGSAKVEVRPLRFTGRAQRLGNADVPALLELYADGEGTGESPDFFYPSMVANGVFFGIYEDQRLVSAAGTHLHAPDEQAVAIGNIYTLRDRRGHGLGRVATSAVLDAVKGINTVGLNVRAENQAALHLYESLGFVRHCPFFEGLATSRGHS